MEVLAHVQTEACKVHNSGRSAQEHEHENIIVN